MAAEVAPNAALTARHLEAVRRLAGADKPEGHLDLPGLSVNRRRERLVVARTDARGVQEEEATVWPTRRLDVPGMTEYELARGAVLGLMPEAGIRRLLGERLRERGLRVRKFSSRYSIVRPVSMMSSTMSTSLPSMDWLRSRVICTTPLDCVASP